MNLLTGDKINQGHPTTVFGEISVRSPLEWLKFSGAQEQLKISKMFRGDEFHIRKAVFKASGTRVSGRGAALLAIKSR